MPAEESRPEASGSAGREDPDGPRHDAWFHARAAGWKRAVARMVAFGNQALDALPPMRWAYRRQLFASLDWSAVELELGPEAAGLDGLRIAFLSDLHAGSYLRAGDLDELFRQLAARAPDLVLFGGDLVHTRAWEVELYEGPLRRLAPPLGMFAVPGNHERFRGLSLDAWIGRIEQFGVEVLLNRGTRIARGGASLWLAGVDDLTEGRPDLDAALAGRADGEPTVLVSHHPDLFPEAAGRGIELTLSGHTHGGQIAPFGWVPVRHSAQGFDRGAHRIGASRLHVGRGIGAVVLPLRLGARPELPIVTLRCRR
jgi:predicted MPP superfamily phosphohydrolase